MLNISFAIEIFSKENGIKGVKCVAAGWTEVKKLGHNLVIINLCGGSIDRIEEIR